MLAWLWIAVFTLSACLETKRSRLSEEQAGNHEMPDPNSPQWHPGDSPTGSGGAEAKPDPDHINETVSIDVNEPRQANPEQGPPVSADGKALTEEAALNGADVGSLNGMEHDPSNGRFTLEMSISPKPQLDDRSNTEGGDLSGTQRGDGNGPPRATRRGVKTTVSANFSSREAFSLEVKQGTQKVLADFKKAVTQSSLKNPGSVASVSGAVTTHNQSVAQITGALPGVNTVTIEVSSLTPEESPEGRAVRNARNYVGFVKARIEAEGGPNLETRLSLVAFAEMALDLADKYYAFGNTPAGRQAINVVVSTIDVALTFVPGVSFGKDVVSLVTGRVMGLGAPISPLERAIILGQLFIPTHLSGSAKAFATAVAVIARHAVRNHLFEKILDAIVEADGNLEGISSESAADGARTGDLIEQVGTRATLKIVTESKQMKVSLGRDGVEKFSAVVHDKSINQSEKSDLVLSFDLKKLKYRKNAALNSVFRYHDQNDLAPRYSRFVNEDRPFNKLVDRARLAIAAENKMTFLDEFHVRSCDIFAGTAAPNHGEVGGGNRIYLLGNPQDVLDLVAP